MILLAIIASFAVFVFCWMRRGERLRIEEAKAFGGRISDVTDPGRLEMIEEDVNMAFEWGDLRTKDYDSLLRSIANKRQALA